ncbi:MAG: glycoside hydrolase family 28 protein [Bacteroidales bacterium]|nr:glycoside hydrolase family 28 protein [Bacteroidales bacterium]
MKVHLIALIYLASAFQLESQTTWTNVKLYGADSGGNVKCTGIINQLIDSLAGKGGGTLFFPSGTYFTGPIILKSNITLYLDAGAVIQFSDDFDDYLPMVQTRWEDIRVKNFISQIYAYQCENIAIRGDGHFNGKGQKWWDFWNKVRNGDQADSKWQTMFKSENAGLLQKNEYLREKNAFLRPPMVITYECKNVLIEGVSFSDPPFWTIVPTFSDNITIEGVTIENPDYSPNTDGIDLSSCTNVHISNSHITVGDDCIVIKSGRDEDGRDANRPTENVTITNCTMLKGHGGVVIGSEMSGNVKRVAISNCVFEGTDVGIRIKTMRGRGGVVEDIRVSNILMYNMVKEGIIITMRYQPTNPEILSERTPIVRNVHLSGINIRKAERAIAIYGLEEKEVSQITFVDMQIEAKNGILVENAADVSFSNIRLEIENGIPFTGKDSKLINYDRIAVKSFASGSPYLTLKNCQTVRISNCFQPEIIPLFIETDEKCDQIYLLNNIMPNTKALYNKNTKQVRMESNIIQKSKSNI